MHRPEVGNERHDDHEGSKEQEELPGSSLPQSSSVGHPLLFVHRRTSYGPRRPVEAERCRAPSEADGIYVDSTAACGGVGMVPALAS